MPISVTAYRGREKVFYRDGMATFREAETLIDVLEDCVFLGPMRYYIKGEKPE